MKVIFSYIGIVAIFFSFYSVAFADTGTFLSGLPARVNALADTSSATVFRFNCDPTLQLDALYFYGGFNGVSSNASVNVGTATTTVQWNIGDSNTGNRLRKADTFTPQSCDNGYIDINYYRSGTAVTMSYSNAFSNGLTSDWSNTAQNAAYCYSNCGSIPQDYPVGIMGQFSYKIALASSSGGGSSDMSTSTLEYVLAPFAFAYGIILFLLAIITWFFITRRNKK